MIFEGEYINEQRWNGKGYDEIKKRVYEFKKGKGYLKEYDKEGKLVFEGEYVNEKKNGKGKEYFCDKLIFEGEYLYSQK